MNFLDLCQAAARESGTIAGLPSFTTVNAAEGRVDKLVNWVRDAWVAIQNERTDWLFRLATFDKALIIGQKTYTGPSFGLAVSSWLPDTCERRTMSLYDPAIGQSDEGYLQQLPFDRWRATYDFGAPDPNRPQHWAVSPAGELCVGPSPDKAYAIRGQYRTTAQRLVADTDVPTMPEDYHALIVGEALRLMARSDEAFQVLQEKAERYEQLRYPLVRDQTPALYTMQGQPLA